MEYITMKYVDFEREHFFSRLIWLFPIALLFHFIEESNSFAYWVTSILMGEIDVYEFYSNNIAGILSLIVLCYFSNIARTTLVTFVLFLWVSCLQFWDSVFHIYTQYLFHTYSPGYFTAILLYLPLYSYLSYLSLRERFIPWYLWLLGFVLGCFLLGLIIWAKLYHFRSFPWEMYLPWWIFLPKCAILSFG